MAFTGRHFAALRHTLPWALLLVLTFGSGTLVAAPDDKDASAKAAPHAAAFLEHIAKDGEAKALDQLHATDQDPWIVAEELLLLGKSDVALRLSQARLSADDTALTAYVKRAPKVPRALAEGVVRGAALIKGENHEQVLELLQPSSRSSLTVTEVRSLQLRALALVCPLRFARRLPSGNGC